MAQRQATATVAASNASAANYPVFELRMKGLGNGELELSIWQLTSPATPRLKEPERTASLWGRSLRLVESRVLKRLRGQGVKLRDLRKGDTQRAALDEDVALNLALLFRALAPMRSLDRIRAVAEGIDNMTREEAGYWLGMAVHRSHPRRVLAALRVLLTMP
jgi:hypothetical protein